MANLHMMLIVKSLGESYEAPIVEIAAKVFDPETGELGIDHCTQLLDVNQALRTGKAAPGTLANYMLAHKYDLLIFNNPHYFETLVPAVDHLREYIDAQLEQAGVKWENLRVYNLYPAYELPRITFIDQAVIQSKRALWPSYGVVCAKTLQDMARPLLVEYKIDLPQRPASRKGISDECDYQAVVTMHSYLMLRGDHPKQVVRLVNKMRGKAPTVPDEDDEEL